LAGLGFGTLFGVGGYLIQDPATSASGRTIALGTPRRTTHGTRTTRHTHELTRVCAATSLTLAGVMGSRFVRTRKLYPAGVLAAVGLGSSAWHGYAAFVRVEDQVVGALHTIKETGHHEIEKVERKLKGGDSNGKE
jgi:uncharacterized membrane protein (UPF0136 family)